MKVSVVLILCQCACLAVVVPIVYGSRVILVENAPMCFRRVLAGQRALRGHVRRVLSCERLEDCRRECALEKRFHCESFNYRLDPSFRGKGLCEMMTKPIEEFDLRRDFVEDKDYDFYELDRNSLEPHCQSTLRGPSMLHSGYLSSKPDWRPGYQGRWRDRHDTGGYNNRQFYKDPYDRYDDRRYHGRRRFENHNYIPYQIGIGRSNDDQESWGKYGGNYGGYEYYKDNNDYRNSMHHWRLSDGNYERPEQFYGVRPYNPNTDFDYYSLGSKKYDDGEDNYGYGYGSWRRSWNGSHKHDWNGLSFGETKYYGPNKDFRPSNYDDKIKSTVQDCSSRRKAGMSLVSGAIRRSVYSASVLECEAACFGEREFKCVSYSYRYSKSHGTDNCFLSERPYRGLELASDSGSDVYAMPQHQNCPVSHTPWVESECFWHVRTGASVSGSSVKAALNVAGLGACEAECIRAHGFFCRGFSFRFDSPIIGDEVENCLLTSSPPTTLEPGHGLRPTPGHELYSRGNYGRGCEPALYDESAHRHKQCYLKYDNAARLIGAAVRGQTTARDEEACGVACTDAPFRCLSFSFKSNAPPYVDNCLLSEIRLFDLELGVDYEHSADDWLFAFDLFNGQCWRKVNTAAGKDDESTPELPRPITSPGIIRPPAREPGIPNYGPPVHPPGPIYGPSLNVPSGPNYGPSASLPSGASYGPSSNIPSGPSFGPSASIPSGPSYGPSASLPSGPSYGPSANLPSGPSYGPPPLEPSGLLPSRPGYLPKPHPPPFIPSSGPPGYLPDAPTYRPLNPNKPSYRPLEPPAPGYGSGSGGKGPGEVDGLINVSWQHYTVSGFPCRQGTSCAQNVVAGHWSCEPEGGEVGSWDYCCAPDHRCGYSEGFHKPWCYVGSSEEQWRPCSEKYYPYHQHNVPHPSQGHRDERPHRPSYGGPPRAPPSAGRPHHQDSYLPIEEDRRKPAFIGSPYLPEADRKYWDDLYNNGPSAYYDGHGNPLPGYVRVPTSGRPHIKYNHNYGPRPGDGAHWLPISGLDSEESLDPPVPGGLGVPRYWPVAYLHKDPPPNMTYFRFNETQIDRMDKMPISTSTERYDVNLRPLSPPREKSPNVFNKSDQDKISAHNLIDGSAKNNHRDEKTRNISVEDMNILKIDTNNMTNLNATTPSNKFESDAPKAADKDSISLKETKDSEEKSELEKFKSIDGKLDDFTGSVEVLDIEDAKVKGDKESTIKTLEAEERQIEAIGRLLASRRGTRLNLEKRSQKNLETQSIAIDKELLDDDFNFGTKFPTGNIERRGVIQKVTKDDIESDILQNKDKSLEVSETTYVRPPRILSTSSPNTEHIRKAYVNGKVFYDATVRDQKELYVSNNATRKQKALNFLKASEDSRINPLTQSYGKKKIKTRNVNPVRRVRRVYRKRYNPEEVRKRLLDRERGMKESVRNLSVLKRY